MAKRDIQLPDARYVAVLERQRARIAGGLPLVAYDDTTPGNKEMHCSWGLCSRDRGAWPDAADHLWPDQFTNQDRVAPLYRKPHQLCPLDKRTEPTGNGCFYTCRIFQSRNNKRPTREQTVELYDAALLRARTP